MKIEALRAMEGAKFKRLSIFTSICCWAGRHAGTMTGSLQDALQMLIGAFFSIQNVHGDSFEEEKP